MLAACFLLVILELYCPITHFLPNNLHDFKIRHVIIQNPNNRIYGTNL